MNRLKWFNVREQASGPPQRKKIGLALGSGSARGLSHIGIIESLAEMGIEPDIVCGASMGAVIGAAYCGGTLNEINTWAQKMDRAKIVSYFDINWLGRGGPIKGEQLLGFLRNYLLDKQIEALPIPFGAVAADLNTGEEVWLREGSVLNAVRASAALPGILPPWQWENPDGNTRWLIDGGVVNPVPVSLCRAMGADIVIAVNLNEYLVKPDTTVPETDEKETESDPSTELPSKITAVSLLEKVPLVDKFPQVIPPALRTGIQGLLYHESTEPSYFTVVANSIKIMQYQIAHVLLAKDPPDVLLTPHLGEIHITAFDRAVEIIAEGRATVSRAQKSLEKLIS